MKASSMCIFCLIVLLLISTLACAPVVDDTHNVEALPVETQGSPTPFISYSGEGCTPSTQEYLKGIFESDTVADHTYVLLYDGEDKTLISAEAGICLIRREGDEERFFYFDKPAHMSYDPTCRMSKDGKHLALTSTFGAYIIDLEANRLDMVSVCDGSSAPDDKFESILMPSPNVLGWLDGTLYMEYPFEASADYKAGDPASVYFSYSPESGLLTQTAQPPACFDEAPSYDKQRTNSVVGRYFRLYEENLLG